MLLLETDQLGMQNYLELLYVSHLFSL